MGKMVMADSQIPRWLAILAVVVVVALVAVLLAAEYVMNTSFSQEAVRAGVKTEFNKTKSCLMQALSPYASPDQSDSYAKLISSYLIRGINTSEIFVREVRRDGWAYDINTTIRYNDLPLADQDLTMYASLLGERRIVGAAPDLGGQFGPACAKTCEDNMLVFDKEACHTACGKINSTLAQSNCLLMAAD